MRRWLPWLLLAVVVLVSLAVGASGSDGADSDAARSARLAKQVRCPTCRGLSAAESDAKAAQAVRAEIRSRVEAGESDENIRAYLASRYGQRLIPFGRPNKSDYLDANRTWLQRRNPEHFKDVLRPLWREAARG